MIIYITGTLRYVGQQSPPTTINPTTITTTCIHIQLPITQINLITQNAFEIYGADFMLSDNLQPWLLEINSSPTMACSTIATDHLVTNLMDDIVKGSYLKRNSFFILTCVIYALA